MQVSPTAVEVMRDPALFGPLFAAPSWRRWVLVCAVIFGLTDGLTAEDLDDLRRLTRRTRVPETQAREAWLVVGRRAG